MIPFLDLKREWQYFEKQFLQAFKRFGRSGIFVLGPEVESFEKNFADFCGYKYAVGVSTGLSALETALLAHGIKPGDEVITVANSAVATALAISNIGAKPVFCDIGDDFLIDPDKIERLITPHTKAILPVHLFGKICDMKKINSLAKKHKLVVVEDACQAHGAGFNGESLFNTKAFSFYPTKNLGALGEGGMVVTNSEAVRDFVCSFRNYGQRGRYNHIIKGNNFRLDPLQCVFMSVKLKKFGQFVKKRQAIAKKYFNALNGLGGVKMSGYDISSSFHLFVIRVLNNRRDELKEYLKQKGVETAVHYPTPIHKQPCYVNECHNLKLSNTERLQDEILSLPCNPFLTVREVKKICEEIKNFY